MEENDTLQTFPEQKKLIIIALDAKFYFQMIGLKFSSFWATVRWLHNILGQCFSTGGSRPKGGPILDGS